MRGTPVSAEAVSLIPCPVQKQKVSVMDDEWDGSESKVTKYVSLTLPLLLKKLKISTG